jgi:putative FmdB family regulatory protein
MPTYEYLCQACSHRFETWQKMTDEPLTTCPECGSHIRRVLYPAGLVFKGSGFYKTDYGNGISPSSNHHQVNGDGAGESKPAGESKASENGASSKASQDGASSKTSESGASPAGVK